VPSGFEADSVKIFLILFNVNCDLFAGAKLKPRPYFDPIWYTFITIVLSKKKLV